MDAAVVGGTGAEGFGLALRLAQAGHRVTIGSRAAEKAADAVVRAKELLGDDVSIDGAVNDVAVTGRDLVAVTVPFAGMIGIYKAIGPALESGQLVLDTTSPLMAAVGGKASEAIRPWHGSAAELASSMVPDGARLVAGLHTIAAGTSMRLDGPLESDVPLCGDDAEAKAMVGALLDSIPGTRWVDCGPLSMARITETLTPLLISINRKYKTHDAGFRIVGRDAWGAPAR
jgi:8-hydroxy-5-deazaflavin:NADPH oxidoreductase